MKNKNHGKTLSILTMISVMFSVLLLCGCPSEPEGTTGVQIGFSLGNETTINNYFRKVYITNGETNIDNYLNVRSSGQDVSIDFDDVIATSSGGRITPKYFTPPRAAPQWRIGDTITVVLIPKDETDDHLYGYWDSTHNNKYLNIKQNSAYTQARNTLSKSIRVWSESSGDYSEFLLNYKQGFVTTFTVTADKVIIDLNCARPDTIEGEDIRLKNSNGYVYIDKTNIPNSLFGSYVYLEKANSSDNFTVYRLPLGKICFCELNKNLKIEMRAKHGFTFDEDAILYLNEERTVAANKTSSGYDASDSIYLTATFTTPNTSGSILHPTLSENPQVEITDFFIGKIFRSSYENDDIELTFNNDNTFDLTWGSHNFEGNYVMENDYYEHYGSTLYHHVMAALTSTTEITKNGESIRPNWTIEYIDPDRPNCSDVARGYSLTNSNYSYRWPETSTGNGIRVNLGNPVTNP